MTRTILRALAALGLAALLAGCAATTLPPVHSETERLALARRMMEQRRWASAIELLKGYIEHNAGAADVDQAVYLLGDAYLHNKEWALAANEFDRMLKDYPEWLDRTLDEFFRVDGVSKYEKQHRIFRSLRKDIGLRRFAWQNLTAMRYMGLVPPFRGR